MDNLFDKIKENRNNLADSSIRQYVLNLKKIRKLMNITDDPNQKFLEKVNDVSHAVNSLDKITTKKNLYTTILVIGRVFGLKQKFIDIYTDNLKQLNVKYNSFLQEQVLTDTQKEKWANYNDIINLSNNLLEKVNNFKNEKILNALQMRTLMDLVIIRSYLITPARNSFADMKVAEEEEDMKNDHNYILLDEFGTPLEFVLNKYKTSKNLGQRRIEIDKDTAKIIKLWLHHNNSGDFLTKLNDEPMTSNYLTKYLQSLFKKYLGKSISSSMLRHIMISHDMKFTPTIQENKDNEEKIKTKYQHSAPMNALYRKIS